MPIVVMRHVRYECERCSTAEQVVEDVVPLYETYEAMKVYPPGWGRSSWKLMFRSYLLCPICLTMAKENLRQES